MNRPQKEINSKLKKVEFSYNDNKSPPQQGNKFLQRPSSYIFHTLMSRAKRCKDVEKERRTRLENLAADAPYMYSHACLYSKSKVNCSRSNVPRLSKRAAIYFQSVHCTRRSL